MSAWATGSWAADAWYGTAWYEVVLDETKTGGKGDNPKRRTIVKPTGLVDRKATPSIQQRIEESAQILEEVKARAYDDVAEVEVTQPPIETMSQAEIDFEIGVLLRKKLRTQDEEVLLMMLMMA